MKSGRPILIACVLWSAGSAAVDAEDVRVEQLRQDVAELNRVVREQARKIESLEREIARLKSAATPGRPRSAKDGADVGELAWVSSGPWRKLRPGMSESEVIALLGPPTAVRGDGEASKTLLYTLELEGTGFLSGSVELGSGQVREVREPQLR
ncbi:MAG: hypothetical protein ACT4O5_01640 [Gammaproteobacteria bacterium]